MPPQRLHFIEVPRQWLMVDVDNFRLRANDDLIDDPESVIAHAISEILPACFQDVRCFWQLSSSAGFERGVLKTHLFYWLTESLIDGVLKRTLRQHAPGITDLSVYQGVQPHYVASPIIEGGPDPIPRRFALEQAGISRDQATTWERLAAVPDEVFEQALAEPNARATGKKPGGRPPAAPVEGPLPTDQVNLTDEESRVMPVAGGGFEQCYNAQATVAAGSLLVIAADVVQAPNDKQQLEPMLGKLAELPDEWGKAEALLADNGYFSESSVNACAAAGIAPVIAMGREAHHPTLAERFARPPPPKDPKPLEAMDYRLQMRIPMKPPGYTERYPRTVPI
jgi:hypothetical protein